MDANTTKLFLLNRIACGTLGGSFSLFPCGHAKSSFVVANAIVRDFIFCLLLLSVSHGVSSGDELRLKSGKALEKAIWSNIAWNSIQVPLGDQLRDLQRQSEVVILLDRRVDPTQLVSVKTDSAPRVQVLTQISASISDGAFCVTEHSVVVGPSTSVQRLPILLARNNDLVNSLRKKNGGTSSRGFAANIDPSWDYLEEPRQILQRLAQSSSIRIMNPEIIPHDVWSDQQLPKMSFVEAATMILNQFDLTLEFAADKPEVSIVAIDPQETFEHRYAVGSSLKSAATAAWKGRAPDVSVKWVSTNAIVNTTLEKHAVLQGVLSDLQRASTNPRSNAIVPAKSIRSTMFELKAERATLGEMIDYFRANKIPVEVADADSAETKRLLLEIVELNTVTEPSAGDRFFPRIFGKHFGKVEVLDDRVRLSRE